MTSPIQLVPRDDEDGADGVDAGDPVIENISALDDGGGYVAVEGEAVISLSSDTSATSLASQLSDGAPRPRSATRPRSASLGLATPRPGSAPRPRSNPRTRTPMRRESPLLVTGRVADVLISANSGAVEAADGNEALIASASSGHAVADGDANPNGEEGAAVRNLFHARRRNRARSIPEEDEEAIIADSPGGPTTSNERSDDATTADPAPRPAGHWLARAAAAVHPARSARSADPARARGDAGPSAKQGPSRRKLRRWNNDRFVGTSSEGAHAALQNASEGDLSWTEFYMPHYPLEYRSEFARLSADGSRAGKNARDRFAKGEVARRDGSKEGDSNWLERSVVAKFRKMGVSETNGLDEMGQRMFRSLSPRIRSVVSRSCALGDDVLTSENDASENTPSLASQVVSAFESYLVSLALAGSNKDVASAGYPPRQSQRSYDLFDAVLSSPPRVVIRTKRRKSSSREAKHPHAVVVPTVHFYFPADDARRGGGESGQARPSAFYRILLHAVCQFHGLESTSSVVAPRDGRRVGELGNGRRGAVKAVTAQGGALLAPDLKLLDFVE